MAFQPVPNGIKIELNALQNGIPIVNVWYVQVVGAITLTTLQDVAGAVESWWVDSLRDNLHSSYVLQNITCTDVSVENGIQYIETSITTPTGVGVGPQAAANAALCVSWRTGFTGRSFRGRTYFGGLDQTYLVTAQEFASSSVTAFTNVALDLIDALATVGATLVVVSRVAAGIARITALASEVISIIVDSKVDSQRRRTAN